MTHPITGIDHTLIGVADLEAARDIWAGLGFTITPRGRHIGWGTANYCIMFADDYVELLGIVDATQFVNRLDERLARSGEGLLGIALAAPEADAVQAALGPAGLVQPPQDLARLLELPEGEARPRFKLVHFAEDALPALSAFVCQHLTPDLLRRPAWLRHENGATALEGVTVVVENTAALTPAYAALFGAAGLREGLDRLDVRVGRHQLRFLTPARLVRRYPGITFGPALPAAVVMTVLVADLQATHDYLRRRGVPLVEVPGARLVVPPHAATGVVLEFARS